MLVDFLLNQRKKNLDRFGNPINSAITSNMNIGATNLGNYFSSGLKAVTKNPQKNNGKWVYNTGAIYNPKTKGITVTEQIYNKIKEKEKKKKKLNFGKKTTKVNSTKSTSIAGYINGIPIRKASKEVILAEKRNQQFNDLIDNLIYKYNLYNKDDLYEPNISKPTLDLTGATNLVDKILRYNKYMADLEAYTNLQKSYMQGTARNNEAYNKAFEGLLKSISPYAYNLAYGSSKESNNNNTLSYKDRVNLASSIIKSLSNSPTGTSPEMILGIAQSIIPDAFISNDKKAISLLTKNQKLQQRPKEDKLKSINDKL